MQLNVLDQKTNFQSGTSYEPKSAIYTEKFNEPLVHQTVTAILAGMRSGTAAQKNRSAVRGGGKKPWKQKGTGRARAGTIRSPLWRKGGVVFAATTQSYKQKLNKKSYKKALNSIFAELFRQNRVIVVSSLDLETHKTKELKNILDTLKLSNTLIITDNASENLLRGSFNLINIEVAEVNTVNPLQLMQYDNVLIDLNGLKALEERLSS